ncbi:MAG: DUF5721 family protein [Defluviitaleaceae bacterium]|nr:DUF5721 family protein [Defluviitaleaceae bacterium]
MIAVTMEPQSVKAFMNRMFKENVMDHFEVRVIEMALTTRITIDGVLEAKPTGEDTEAPPKSPGFITWEAMRPLIMAIIKTGAKPKMIKFVFSYKAQEAINLHPNAAALFLNMVYENDAVHFTTATAQKQFALDKALDDTWDGWVRAFFAENGIVVTDRE